MQQHTRRRFQLRPSTAFSQPRTFPFPLVPLSACLLSAALSGCTRSEVSLGSGQEVAEGEPVRSCGDGIVEGKVITSNQQQIERLRGCREVTGDLQVLGFPDMDLSPLSELRIVRGNLLVGSVSPIDLSPDAAIGSLEGLQGLEEVNGLTLARVMAPDLSGLASLRRVNHDPLGPHAEGGELRITGCDELRDLSGLDSLVDFAALTTEANAQLESLDGLRLPLTLRSVSLRAEPSLNDLSALARMRRVGDLQVEEMTALENLNRLRVQSVENLRLIENDALIDVDSLRTLGTLRTLTVIGNDRLLDLPSLDGVGGVETVTVLDNAELRSLPSFLGGATIGMGVTSESSEPQPWLLDITFGFEFFQVGGNAKLTRIAGIGSQPQGRVVVIHDNPSLTEIDLGALNDLQGLHVMNNAALATVRLTPPARVAELQVRDNPLLSTATFAGVQTFSSLLSGNLDSP